MGGLQLLYYHVDGQFRPCAYIMQPLRLKIWQALAIASLHTTVQPSGPPPLHLLTGPPIPRRVSTDRPLGRKALPVPKPKTSAQWGLRVKGAHAKLKAMPPPPKLQAIPVAVMPPPEHGHCLLLLLEHGALYVRHVCVRHCAQTGMAIGGWGK